MISFLYLVDATGTKRVTLDHSDDWLNQPKILKSNHTFNCFSAVMEGELITKKTQETQEFVDQINSVGKTEYLNKTFHLEPKLSKLPLGFGCGFTLKKNNKARLYMASSLPDGLSHENIPDFGKLLVFFNTFQGLNFKLAYKDPNESKNPAKRKIKNDTVFNKFQTFVSALDKPVHCSSSGKPTIIYVGDSRISHIFFGGFGANEAFQDAMRFGKCLSKTNDDFDLELFLQLTKHDFKATENYELNVVEQMRKLSSTSKK